MSQLQATLPHSVAAALLRTQSSDRPYFRLPTLLWSNATDAAISSMQYLGVLCGISAVYGGQLGLPCLLLGLAFWLSLEPHSLFFPRVGMFARTRLLPRSHPPNLAAMRAGVEHRQHR